ncbi:hypothetical protein PILCRDRAFT_560004 [Piloderma croceum F 1598]|uniref:Uncharacterized protein n=1 Tax=Piloderma croceum (strain F 1598) TaxID=765440 RepID=A0A0C3FIF6_PILCF|nr:hypothetical protein PILCRDRAFT_560004 [Piloderma croceum F 1598]
MSVVRIIDWTGSPMYHNRLVSFRLLPEYLLSRSAQGTCIELHSYQCGFYREGFILSYLNSGTNVNILCRNSELHHIN